MTPLRDVAQLVLQDDRSATSGGPNLGHLGPSLAELGGNLADAWPKWADSGPNSVELGRGPPKYGRVWTTFARPPPDVVAAGAKLADPATPRQPLSNTPGFAQDSAEVASNPVDSAPKLAALEAGLADAVPDLADAVPKLAELGRRRARKWADVGAAVAELGRHRAES